jgi:hypothetical protein
MNSQDGYFLSMLKHSHQIFIWLLKFQIVLIRIERHSVNIPREIVPAADGIDMYKINISWTL